MSRISLLIANGWLQWGVLLRKEMPSDVSGIIDQHNLSKCSHFVIATQTCCIAHGSFEHEPSMELIGGVILENKPDRRLIGGYSPRELHIPIVNNGVTSTLHLEMRCRVFIPRQLFETFSATGSCIITDRYMHNLQVWMASRYCRPAFPDELVMRVSGFAKKLAEKLTKYSAKYPDDLIMVLVNYTPNCELDSGSVYSCEWKLVYSADIDEVRQKDIIEIEAVFSSRLEDIDGIEGTFVAFDETEVSIQDLREGERWFFDYISYRGEEVGAVVEDGQY